MAEGGWRVRLITVEGLILPALYRQESVEGRVVVHTCIFVSSCTQSSALFEPKLRSGKRLGGLHLYVRTRYQLQLVSPVITCITRSRRNSSILKIHLGCDVIEPSSRPTGTRPRHDSSAASHHPRCDTITCAAASAGGGHTLRTSQRRLGNWGRILSSAGVGGSTV